MSCVAACWSADARPTFGAYFLWPFCFCVCGQFYSGFCLIVSDRPTCRAPVFAGEGSSTLLMNLPWSRDCELPLTMLVTLPLVMPCACAPASRLVRFQDNFEAAFRNAFLPALSQHTNLNKNVQSIVVSYLSAPPLVSSFCCCHYLFTVSRRTSGCATAQPTICSRRPRSALLFPLNDVKLLRSGCTRKGRG